MIILIHNKIQLLLYWENITNFFNYSGTETDGENEGEEETESISEQLTEEASSKEISSTDSPRIAPEKGIFNIS